MISSNFIACRILEDVGLDENGDPIMKKKKKKDKKEKKEKKDKKKKDGDASDDEQKQKKSRPLASICLGRGLL